ncbi:cobalamin-binding radical SAM protein [Desulfosarcina variabilis str. Montpellier]|uniref:lipid biosynthesis B12-binding/radical SAM protein n=1 Tax=Desulfosarcina variabilis TaxID=2300 RepID=UPI003AFB137A
MKILLVSANTLKEPYPVYPLGLDHVAASIHARHQVCIEDLNALPDTGSLAQRIRQFEPQLIGISLRNIDNTDTTDPVGFIGGYREVIKVIRQVSRVPIVLGGSGFTLFPHRVMSELAADFGTIGEGERFNLLIDALEAGMDPRGLPGIILPDEKDVAFPAPWAGSRTPRPDQQVAHLTWYIEHGAMLNLQTKRGCPFRCIYCTYPLIEGRKLRLVAPDEAAQTALALETAGARYIYITDSSFNADIDHSLAVARAFKNAGVTVPWGTFFTPMHLPEGYFETLAEAGLKHVEFGTDTLSDTVLKSYCKPFTVEQVFTAHEAALGAGCHVAHYFLLGGPGETVSTLQETLDHIDTLRKTILFFFCGMRVYPHTALFDRCLADGQLEHGADLLAPFFYQTDAIDKETIMQQVSQKAAGRFNWVFGGGGDVTASIIRRMYAKGFSGPLWEYLAR